MLDVLYGVIKLAEHVDFSRISIFVNLLIGKITAGFSATPHLVDMMDSGSSNFRRMHPRIIIYLPTGLVDGLSTTDDAVFGLHRCHP